MKKSIWFRSLMAAAISGGAGGVSTGLATMGISPDHFNLQDPGLLIKVCVASIVISAAIGVSGFLKQSPLPPAEDSAA